jgi:cytochrome b561
MMIDEQLAAADAAYDPITVRLHWLTAGLVATLWILGQTSDWWPKPYSSVAWSVHVTLGFMLAVVLVTRVVWRTRFGAVLPPADRGLLHWIARATHYALYALLFTVVATGLANASYRGYSLFELWHVPQFGTGDRATRRSINGWHELAANTILVLALVHAAAALVHRYVWRDQVMRRMRLGP